MIHPNLTPEWRALLEKFDIDPHGYVPYGGFPVAKAATLEKQSVVGQYLRALHFAKQDGNIDAALHLDAELNERVSRRR